MDKDSCLKEVARFADLDSEPIIVQDGTDYVIGFRQRGEDVRLTIDSRGGRVIEVRDGKQDRHGTYRGLLASRGFGDLRRLVEAQKAFLVREASYIQNTSAHLPIVGTLEIAVADRVNAEEDLLESVNRWLMIAKSGSGRVRALVVDGPAGIGKTHLIRRLSFQRATAFGPGSAPPILHVQSRGRKLTTLDHLIAGTLQVLRLAVTFEQVPILARHGLLQIAIDGFDELADPNGYETAWGSVRDFIEEIAGDGTLILAGRDTFIDVGSVKRALPVVDSPATGAVHLRSLTAAEAKKWLSMRGWSKEKVRSLGEAGLLEQGSYALRPFFISKIAELGADQKTFDDFIAFPLRALVEAILDREAQIIGEHVRLIGSVEFRGRLSAFFQEVAREMADAETDAIDEGSLVLIAELVFAGRVHDDDLGMLRHRVKALVLLEQDAAQDRRRFPHTEIQDYFLGWAYLELVGQDELPKSIHRNIHSMDFLETFHDIAATADSMIVELFLRGAIKILGDRGYEDRTRRNLPAMILAAISGSASPPGPVRLEDLSLDEALMRGTAPPCNLVSVEISQLDARGADLSALTFRDCWIGGLIADPTTVLPASFPKPGMLSLDQMGRSKPEWDERKALEWVNEHTTDDDSTVRHSEYLSLFEKLCRVMLRQAWIREEEDDRAGRLLMDARWPPIREVLERHGLLEVRTKPAGGPRSQFYRIHRAKPLLDPTLNVDWITQVRREIAALGVD